MKGERQERGGWEERERERARARASERGEREQLTPAAAGAEAAAGAGAGLAAAEAAALLSLPGVQGTRRRAFGSKGSAGLAVAPVAAVHVTNSLRPHTLVASGLIH